MLGNKHQWNFNQNNQNETLSFTKMQWKYRLRNGGHFVLGRWVNINASEAYTIFDYNTDRSHEICTIFFIMLYIPAISLVLWSSTFSWKFHWQMYGCALAMKLHRRPRTVSINIQHTVICYWDVLNIPGCNDSRHCCYYRIIHLPYFSTHKSICL